MERPRVEDAAPCRDLCCRAGVANACELRLGGVVEKRHCLVGQCLPPTDLRGVGRRLEREAERSPGLARRNAGEPLEHVGKLEELEGAGIHPASLGASLPTPSRAR